ncbi:MAG TPA: S8 family serine peptidase [Pyrinomonadaceae bacterium]|jgi:Subtilisin-like serine proteases|nr:S8 family serine peptidase [Pyrinomonadaceae bacterium]
MSEILTNASPKTKPACRLCTRSDGSPIHFDALPLDLQKLVETNSKSDGHVCANCVAIFTRAQEQLKSHPNIFVDGEGALPTPLRMDADERFTGRGVTIAFLDSGFYAHKDLTEPTNRIVAYHSIFAPEDDPTFLLTPDVASWHGMMTSVVAAGNGFLSDGLYRGIAPDANVVLVKIGKTGRIPESSIESGLRWVLKNKEQFEIRIVNISAGGDFEQSYLENSLCELVEEAVKEGLVVVCAVGNAGLAPGHPVLPPASSPSSIAVGGLDDQNSLNRARRGMYRSSYGPTVDGLQKPEVIAPGIWVAAPILPHTPTADEAQLYATLDSAPDDELRNILVANQGVDKDIDECRDLPIPLLRQLITIKLREGNVINEHYKFVDGTSFASPIVASIVACMLEANPKLSPQQVKRILIETAERVSGVEVDRQGWGVVSPRKAIGESLRMRG